MSRLQNKKAESIAKLLSETQTRLRVANDAHGAVISCRVAMGHKHYDDDGEPIKPVVHIDAGTLTMDELDLLLTVLERARDRLNERAAELVAPTALEAAEADADLPF